jgi:hypothetical protein
LSENNGKESEKRSKKILTNPKKWGIIIRQAWRNGKSVSFLYGEVLKLAEEAPLLRV